MKNNTYSQSYSFTFGFIAKDKDTAIRLSKRVLRSSHLFDSFGVLECLENVSGNIKIEDTLEVEVDEKEQQK